MGTLISEVTGKLVAFDASPLIYYLENHPQYTSLVDELFEAVDKAEIRGITSVLTLLEVLTKPLREGQKDLAEAYRRHLGGARGLTVYPIDEQVCERAAQLRARHAWLRTPDAMQIGTALEYGAELVVTNDERWKRLIEIRVIVLRDYVPVQP